MAESNVEAARPEKFQADVSGGGWLTNKLEQSSISRGLQVYVLRASVPKSEMSDLLVRAENRAAISRGSAGGIRAVEGFDEARTAAATLIANKSDSDR